MPQFGEETSGGRVYHSTLADAAHKGGDSKVLSSVTSPSRHPPVQLGLTIEFEPSPPTTFVPTNSVFEHSASFSTHFCNMHRHCPFCYSLRYGHIG